MMTVSGSLGKGRALPCTQDRLPFVFDQDDLAGQDKDKLILMAVPVPLAGPVSGRKSRQIDPVIRQTTGITEPWSAPTEVVHQLG